ncbi:MAG: GH3 auxin-responsive promoter family protein [Muribaculaceae bacterium]|nr:GH3 auxin-responsive promoter family protein [Muribaculaceae bacterium]MBR1551300.1 GH3 auxin-responsive promoter family protein [Muribaculaceae bacterium]
MSRLRQQERYIDHADAVQQGELVRLVERAALTTVGRQYDFSTVRTYHDFASRVPLYRYEDLQPLIMRTLKGEVGVLWPGRTYNFAQSSGTSDGRSKYIPITRESFRWNHYQGASDVVAHYLNLNPSSRIFSGKALILGGSFANNLTGLKPGVRVGDLSASLIDNINPLAGMFRVPRKRIALMEDWNEKLPALVEASMREDITNLSGVPSWFLTVLKRVLERTGASCIHEVWPHLEVFFHGGIAFGPYREQYERLCDMSRMHFLDTYNASEGFFAVQSAWESTAMLLLLDVGVFYEFIPIEDTDSEHPEVYPIWEIEAGRTYELVITACNGLWRYRLGDTVTVEQLAPVKIKIAGRTRAFINAFGEELMVHNADEAIAHAAAITGAQVLNYTAAPVFADDRHRGHHQWLVEFATVPATVERFAQALDDRLRQVNSDYDAKRTGDIFLAPPLITVAEPGLFDRWLASTGKLGGQRKVPRLANDRHLIDAMLAMSQ